MGSYKANSGQRETLLTRLLTVKVSALDPRAANCLGVKSQVENSKTT